MNELQKFKIFNELKTVTRGTSVQNRKESSAEHSWSCLMLAEYFLSKMDEKIDKLKVFELLMYHDVVEIESRDRALNPKKNLPKKGRIELDAAKTLKKNFPLFWERNF